MNGDPAAAAGALDRPITVTIFPSISGAVKNEVTLSLRDLASQIPLTVAPAKENLKLIKLGRFGNVRSRKGSLRHDDNLIELCGVEGDYDGEVMPPAEMAEALERAGIAALVYTTPSYASDKLRWRVLAPFAQPQPPTFRGTAMSRLQGLIAHDFGRESWGCSQSFFIGHVQGAPPPQVWLIEGTRCIDQADDLDRTARGKPAAKSECKGNGSVPDDGQAGFVFDVGSVDVSAELDAIAIGRGSHDALVRLAGFWAGQGMNAENIAASLQTALLRRPDAHRDAGWRKALDDIPRLVEWVASKEQVKRDAAAAADATATLDELDSDWPELHDDAMHGLAGEIVCSIAPHTESDPVAILAQLLTYAGNAIGHGPHYQVERSRHGTNLFCCLAGRTSKGRKGTSEGWVRTLLGVADPGWEQDCIASGLSSGEGLIDSVRDPVSKITKDGTVEIVDAGVVDKRRQIYESEFVSVLERMRREGSSLSAVLRDAWDKGNLATLTKNSPARATGAHISLVPPAPAHRAER
jgi:hypothetical protein